MFKHISLASSSQGNCHLVSADNGESYIMLDCGITMTSLRKKLNSLNIKLNEIKACFVTHEHQDHIKGAHYLTPYMPVYGTFETLNTLDDILNVHLIPVSPLAPVQAAGITVIPFSVYHDAANPVNYLYKNTVGEYGLYITDTSVFDITLEDIRPSLIVIEANFDEVVIEKQLAASQSIVKRDRGYDHILKSRQLEGVGGHLSWQNAVRMLRKMSLGLCKQIILCHVSPVNGAEYFADAVFKSLGGNIPVKQLSPLDIEITTINNDISCPF